MIIEKAYAKLNLSLSVINKRNDGFHNLETIMVPIIDLYDTLSFSLRDDDVFEIVDNNIGDNIIYKAATAFQKKYNTKGATIRLEKRIPLEAGLAGGSADASATLRGLNKLFGLNVPLSELEELALSIGSDTVFCLYNKAAICTGRGEVLNFIDFDFELPVIIFRPTFGILTKDVFGVLKINDERPNTVGVLSALKSRNIFQLDKLLYNDLFSAAIKIKPQLKDIVDNLAKANITAHMSGSGSTIFVLEDKCLKKHLEENNIEYVYLGKHTIKNALND